MRGIAAMRVSKITIGSLLLALMLGVALVHWSLQHKDDCSRFLSGDEHAPSSQFIVTGTREVIIPCNVWLPRQPLTVQILCLVELFLIVIFLLQAAGDIRAHFSRTHPVPDEGGEGN